MPHRGLYATSVYAEFMQHLDRGVRHILAILYSGQALPQTPVTDKTAKRTQRNREIRNRYAAGEPIAQLAEAYGISPQRIHQIIHHKRK